MNKKTKKSALISALSLKYSEGMLIALNEFSLPEIKTEQVSKFIENFELKSALIVISGENENLIKSAKNIKNVKVINVDGLNVYDVLKFKNLILTQESLARAQEVLKH